MARRCAPGGFANPAIDGPLWGMNATESDDVGAATTTTTTTTSGAGTWPLMRPVRELPSPLVGTAAVAILAALAGGVYFGWRRLKRSGETEEGTVGRKGVVETVVGPVGDVDVEAAVEAVEMVPVEMHAGEVGAEMDGGSGVVEEGAAISSVVEEVVDASVVEQGTPAEVVSSESSA